VIKQDERVRRANEAAGYHERAGEYAKQKRWKMSLRYYKKFDLVMEELEKGQSDGMA